MNDSTTMKNPSEPGDEPMTQSGDGEPSKLDMKRPKKSTKPPPIRNKVSTAGDTEGEDCDRVDPKTTKCRRRKDSGRVHAIQHGVLSRNALATLVQLGENSRSLRRLERQFRATFQPRGPLGRLFFDRFWSSYLRLMLVTRMEASVFGSKGSTCAQIPSRPSLIPGSQPTLVIPSTGEISTKENFQPHLPRDLFQKLALLQRYDSHQSREMFRALAVLLLMRRGGESALESWAVEVLGHGRLPAAGNGGAHE